MKIVLNGYYGGFGLSYEATALYLHAKNREAFFYADISTYHNTSDRYAKVHKYKRVTLPEIRSSQYYMIYCTTTDQGELIDHFPEDIVHFDDLDRTDPTLISVVETMGPKAASGKYASLYIEEIPNGTQYKIDNYDGIEELITKDDDDWKIAMPHYISIPTETKIENMWNTIKPESIPDPDLTLYY